MKWTVERTASCIVRAADDLNLDRMPTANELRTLPYGARLISGMRQHDSFDGWANRVGLPRAQHASRRGWRWETWAGDEAEARGFDVVRRPRVKSPWDLIINGHEVDVKSASPSNIHGFRFWCFRIGKPEHVCAYYLLVGLLAGQPHRVLIVPSAVAPLTMLSVSIDGGGKYHRFIDRWDQLDKPTA